MPHSPQNNTIIKALIVDDEKLARQTIIYSLKAFQQWKVCGECDRGDKVIETIHKTKPDVIFLDIKMPGMNGLDICQQLQQFKKPPLVIFITAFDQHAIQAFDFCALDYLLKPYDDKRFAKSIDKAVLSLNNQSIYQQQLNQFKQLSQNKNHQAQHLIVRSVGRIQLIKTDEIIWISTAGNYVELHTKKATILHRVSLSQLAEHLENDFIRVHRTAMLRVSQVIEIISESEGQYSALLKSGNKVPVSQSYKDKLLHALGIQ